MFIDIIDVKEICKKTRALSQEEKLRLCAPIAELIFCNQKSYKEGFLSLEERIDDIAVAGTFSSGITKKFYFACLRILLGEYNMEDTLLMLTHFYYSSLPSEEEASTYVYVEMSIIASAMAVICKNNCHNENQFATFLLSFLGNEQYTDFIHRLNTILEPKAIQLTSLLSGMFDEED